MMNPTAARFLRFGVSLSGLLVLGWVLNGQAAKPAEHRIALPTDWSHRHLVFSRPGSPEQLGRVSRDPRYWQQILRREQTLMLPITTPDLDSSAIGPSMVKRHGKNLKRDWAEDMGTGASAGAGNYPARFSFRGTTANCADAAMPDYVVYGTGLAGSSTQASIVAFDNLYAGCSKLNLGTAANFAVLGSSTVTNAGNTVVTGANIGISPGTSLTGFPPGVLIAPAVEHLGDGVASQAQADANTAYTRFQGLTGATSIASLDGLTLAPGLYKSAAASLALSAGATVTLNGNGIYIFQIGSTLNLAGTVILSGGAIAGNVIWLVGSSATLEGTAVTVGNIVALASITLDGGASLVGRAIALNGAVTLIDNAIATVDMVPSVYWSYNTGGQILTSPLISLDGSQVAFVETTGAFGILIMLKWAASSGTLASPVAPSLVSSASYSTCSAPCMTQILLKDGSGIQTDDTTSSVFYDYGNDIGWVGGARGWLHKITGVFKGVPTEVTTGGFPLLVNASNPSTLSSPVYDSASHNVFVGDLGGILYRVDSTTASVTQSAQLDFGTGIVEGPIVDSTDGRVYVFASSDGSTDCTGASACAAVYQLSTAFSSGASGTKATAGTSVTLGQTPNPMYIGAFDRAYYSSGGANGNLYVCGNTGQNPAVYQIRISAGAPSNGSALVGLTSAAFSPTCSPVTDQFNSNLTGGATERLFVSVQNYGVATGCRAAGCILNFIDTAWQASTPYQLGQQILDNHLNIEEVTQSGTSGLTVIFNSTAGATSVDGSVQWVNQGALAAAPLPNWTATALESVTGNRILDSHGNIEAVTNTGTTGGSAPVWNTIVGGTTIDGTVTWTNAGASLIAALPAAGGTSGIIIDNVLNGALAGTSQVYFTTLSDQVCGTSGTGGCAVQASQSGLN